MPDAHFPVSQRGTNAAAADVVADTRRAAAAGLVREPSPWTWTVAWLLAPVLIFCAAWMSPVVGLPLAALLVLAFRTIKRAPVAGARWELLLGLAVASGLLLVIGFGSDVYNWDWIKHWALMNMLAHTTWPSQISIAGQTLNFRFYLAAYLLPALAAKLLPMVTVKTAAAASFGVGIAFVMSALSRTFADLRPAARIFCAVVATLLCAPDFLGEFVTRYMVDLPVDAVMGMHCEWWFNHASGHEVQYPSIFGVLIWVPHQAIATLITAMLWRAPREHGGLRAPLLAYGAMSLWSPFGMIGLLPLVLLQCWTLRAEFADNVTRFVAAVAVGCAAVVASFAATDAPSAGLSLAHVVGHVMGYPVYLPFLAVSLGPFALILRRKLIEDHVLLLCTVVLMALPVFESDPPDFVMRTCVGPLAVLGVAAARALWEAIEARRLELVATGALILLACLPSLATEVVYELGHGSVYAQLKDGDPARQHWVMTFAPNSDINVHQFFDTCGWKYLSQYFTRVHPAIAR